MEEISCLNCDNKRCPVQKHCYKEWLEILAPKKPVYSFKKGEQIIAEGDKVKGIFFIYSGKVKVSKTWLRGEEFIVRLARNGDILGHRGYGADMIYPISATALTNCQVCFIPSGMFDSLLRANQEFTYHLMMFYASELSRTETRMRNLARMTVRERVADVLLLLQKTFGNQPDSRELDIKLTRKDIANLAGTTYESVVRALGQLNEEQLISLNGKFISIDDQPALEEIADL